MDKKTLIYAGIAFLVGFFGFVVAKNLLVSNPTPESCIVKTVTISEVSEGSSNAIVLTSDTDETFYIDSDVELGLNLESLSAKVLNKSVTLHLPKSWLSTSDQIAQLAIDDVIIFTEFSTESEVSED